MSQEGIVSAVGSQRGGKSAILVMLMQVVIEGDKVPLGDMGPRRRGDQHAAAVNGGSVGGSGEDPLKEETCVSVFAGVAVNWRLGFQQ